MEPEDVQIEMVNLSGKVHNKIMFPLEMDVQASIQQGKPGEAESEMLALAGSDAEADLVLEGIATMAAQPGVSG